MNLFDPEAHLPLEDKIRHCFTRLPRHVQDRYAELSRISGLPVEELLHEAIDVGLDRLKDPAELQSMYDRLDHKQAPFGADPRLRKAGE